MFDKVVAELRGLTDLVVSELQAQLQVEIKTYLGLVWVALDGMLCKCVVVWAFVLFVQAECKARAMQLFWTSRSKRTYESMQRSFLSLRSPPWHKSWNPGVTRARAWPWHASYN